MSDVGRYRKLYTRLWRHPGFAALTEGEKILALYLITGPQTNRLGLYVMSTATAAEDLGTVAQTLKKRLANVCLTFGWVFDSHARVIFIPSWWKWNPPENVNVLKGSLKDLNEIPPCSLVDAFSANIETLPPTLHETFLEGLRQRLPQRPRVQDQEMEHKQKQNAARRGDLTALRGLFPSEQPRTKEGAEDEILNTLAQKTLKLTNRDAPMAHLVDAFRLVQRDMGVSREFSDTDMKSALMRARSELGVEARAQ